MDKGEKILQILENSACLKPGQLTGYLEGTLFREELRVVELHLASCPLCQEALEGIETIANRKTLITSLSLPELPARKPVTEKPAEPAPAARQSFSSSAKKTVAPPPAIPKSTFKPHPNKFLNRPRNLSWLGVTGIAALLLLGGFLFWQYESNTPDWPSFTFYQKGTPEDILTDSSQSPANDTQTNPQSRQLVAENKKKETPKTIFPTDTQSLAAKVLPANKNKQDSAKAASLITAARVPVPDAALSPEKVSEKKIPQKDSAKQPEQKEQTIAAALKKPGQENKPKAKEAVPRSPKTTSSDDVDDVPMNNSDYSTGLRLYQKKQYASALLYLRTAAENNQDPNHWQAVYYSGLCNLEIGKKGRGRRLLKRVAKAGVSLSAKAEEQLEKLESAGNE